jgi:hypothetical protein
LRLLSESEADGALDWTKRAAGANGLGTQRDDGTRSEGTS